jgi:hypothetical protein
MHRLEPGCGNTNKLAALIARSGQWDRNQEGTEARSELLFQVAPDWVRTWRITWPVIWKARIPATGSGPVAMVSGDGGGSKSSRDFLRAAMLWVNAMVMNAPIAVQAELQ